MTTTMLTAAVTAIRSALDAESALEDARRDMRGKWHAAYAATRAAQQSGQTQAVIGQKAKVSAATVGDYLTAASLPAVCWETLDLLPARQGSRFTTLHSLVAGARKANGTPAVREIIAEAAAKVRDIPRQDGAEPDAERVARIWAAAVRKLHAATVPPAAPPAPPAESTTGDGDGEGEGEGEETVSAPAEPPTLDARVLKLAGECEAVRIALSGGGAVSRDALANLQREAAQLARDVAAMLSNTARKSA